MDNSDSNFTWEKIIKFTFFTGLDCIPLNHSLWLLMSLYLPWNQGRVTSLKSHRDPQWKLKFWGKEEGE